MGTFVYGAIAATLIIIGINVRTQERRQYMAALSRGINSNDSPYWDARKSTANLNSNICLIIGFLIGFSAFV